MNITPINKENLEHFQGFITDSDYSAILNDYKILPIGLVADDLKEGVNMAAGAICIVPDDYELKITSFYVAPDYRGRGAGKYLLDEVKRIFGGKNKEFDIEFLLHDEEEENLALFLEKYGFSYVDPEHDVFELTVVDLEKTRFNGKKGDGVPFSKIPGKLINSAQSDALKKGALLPIGGFKSESIEKHISVAIVNEDEIESFLIFEKLSPKLLMLSSFYVKDDDTTTLIHLLERSTDLILDRYPGYVKIIINPYSEEDVEAIEKFSEDVRNISCRYRYVM